MKIWLEALTGKQALLVHHLALKLEKIGHEVIITSRPYSIDPANSNLDRLGRKHHSIGVYGGAKLSDKLIEGAKRIIELARLIEAEQPDLLISFPSPDAFRTAFGLGIKSIQINDTPHSFAPGRLTISLSNALVYSKSIDQKKFEQLGVTKFYPYDGVDELEWLKDPVITSNALEELGLQSKNYVVARCEESKAGYFQEFFPEIRPGSTIVVEVIHALRNAGYDLDIVAFPRYPEQKEELEAIDVIIPKQSIDTISLLSHANVLLTGGGTMSREAALLGTPSIYSFPYPLDVSNYLKDKGFPIYHCPNLNEIPEQILKLINLPPMDGLQKHQLLKSMETPFDGVMRVFKDFELS